MLRSSLNQLANRRVENLLAGSVFGDLGSLKADPSHQTLLAEEKGINSFLKCCRGHGGAESVIGHYEAGCAAQLESAGFFEVLEGVFIHEEESVGKLLDPGLKAIGSRRGIVVARGMSLLEKHSVTGLCSYHESGFVDIGENKDSHGLVPQGTSSRVGPAKFAKSLFSTVPEFRGCLSAALWQHHKKTDKGSQDTGHGDWGIKEMESELVDC